MIQTGEMSFPGIWILMRIGGFGRSWISTIISANIVDGGAFGRMRRARSLPLPLDIEVEL